MKQLNFIESSIVGLLVGVVMAAYLSFLSGTEGYIGHILSWVSLAPLMTAFKVPQVLWIEFIFYVIVYTIYGGIIGAIVSSHRGRKMVFMSIVVLLVISAGIEQKIGTANDPKIPDIYIPVVASVIHALPNDKGSKQYFGDEAIGDLDQDGDDDVAFIIPRIDDQRGVLYYFVAALANDDGHTGTNLLFLGEKLRPTDISIEQGLITVKYDDFSAKKATTTKQMFARVIDGILTRSTATSTIRIATSTIGVATSTAMGSTTKVR